MKHVIIHYVHLCIITYCTTSSNYSVLKHNLNTKFLTFYERYYSHEVRLLFSITVHLSFYLLCSLRIINTL